MRIRRSRRRLAPLDLLGGHVVESAVDDPGLSMARDREDRSCETEVGKIATLGPVLRDRSLEKDICALHVPVDQTFGVSRVEGCGDLGQNRDRPIE